MGEREPAVLPEWITFSEAALVARVDRQTLRRMVVDGEISCSDPFGGASVPMMRSLDLLRAGLLRPEYRVRTAAQRPSRPPRGSPAGPGRSPRAARSLGRLSGAVALTLLLLASAVAVAAPRTQDHAFGTDRLGCRGKSKKHCVPPTPSPAPSPAPAPSPDVSPAPSPFPSDTPTDPPSPSPSESPSPTDPPSPSPSESPSPTDPPSPSPTDPPSPSPSESPGPPPPGGSYPPPSTESSFGSFRVECKLSHRLQVDPIVKPGPKGTLSAHMHDFFGNTSVDSDSTYASMRAAGTTCGLSADTAGYWVPSLVTHDGAFVEPDRMIIYYRNRPTEYGTTTPFPPDFRMIAGGVGTYPHAYWTCEGQSDSSLSTRAQAPPDCGTERLKLHVYFPSCWDGVNIDSTNHRSHVAYAFDESDGTSTDISDDMCPASHPVKIPQVHIRVIFPVSNGPQYELADHTLSPHSDFWNTWDQGELEGWVDRCLHVGISCGLAAD